MINKFSIEGLFGSKENSELYFREKSIILTGDNGNGKTTLLDILYYTLVGDVRSLFKYNFSEILIVFSEEFTYMESIRVTKGVLNDVNILRYFYVTESAREKVMITCESPKYNPDDIFIDLDGNGEDDVFVYSDKPYLHRGETLLNHAEMSSLRIVENIKKVNKSILYFPTYRRLDLDLSSYLNDHVGGFYGVNYQDLPSLNTFSLYDRRVVGISDEDVIRNLENYTKKINEFTSENLDELLKSFVKNFIDQIMEEQGASIKIQYTNDEDVESINKRLTDISQILDLDIEKERIADFSKYYFKQNKQRTDFVESYKKKNKKKSKENQDLMKLIQLINLGSPWMGYLGILEELHDKYQDKVKAQLIPYDYIENQLSFFTEGKLKLLKKRNNEFIIIKKENEIDFNSLSTGEKQLITILVYTALELPQNDPSLIIIDEPEISLHVKWQRELLEKLHEKENVSSIVATHSPFILDNKYRKAAITLVGEF